MLTSRIYSPRFHHNRNFCYYAWLLSKRAQFPAFFVVRFWPKPIWIMPLKGKKIILPFLFPFLLDSHHTNYDPDIMCQRKKLLLCLSPYIFVLCYSSSTSTSRLINLNYNTGFPGSHFLCLLSRAQHSLCIIGIKSSFTFFFSNSEIPATIAKPIIYSITIC